MSIHILKAGVADAFYDKGRFGFQHLGINPGGVMDDISMQTANALVLNPPGEAVLEMHFPAPAIQFQSDALVALSGADFSANILKQPLPINTPVFIQKGAVINFSKPISGARCYLSVHGGFELHRWLNSAATNTICHAGGYKGRRLKANDTISFKTKETFTTQLNDKPIRMLPFRANTSELYTRLPLNILTGHQYNLLTQQGKQLLANETFTISTDSNRMGYRLKGPSLPFEKAGELLSSGVTKGTIQLLPNGQLIILMADHQTTGGYPVIGHVTSTDFSTLAQQVAGNKIRFQLSTINAAQQAIAKQHLHLLQLQNACTLRIKPFIEHANS